MAAGGLTLEGRARRVRPEGPIRFRTSFRNTIYDVMRHRGWKETDSDFDWDFHWADREWVYDVFDTMHLENWQRINHFRNGRELCRKDNLSKNIKRMRRQLEREGRAEEAARYDFTPVTFTLPGDYALFVEEFKRHAGSNVVWIMKPIGKAQGKGIFLFHKLSQISSWKSDSRWKPDNPSVEAYVVQRYIANPYLIGGKKFDMRIYCLVTSYAPLKVYMYRAGFCRFSASRYSNAPEDILNTFVHLTNVAIQKDNELYNADTGGKWDVHRLKMYLCSRHGRAAANKTFQEMQDLCLHSLFAVQKVMLSDKHCFELYGYDIMIDDTLKPWLIEVNASPSLTANTREDYDLKFKLLNDTLDLVDMEGRLRGDETSVGGFDLIWDDGPIESKRPTVWTAMLGADFDRRLNVFKPKPVPSTGGGAEGGGAAGGGAAGGAVGGGGAGGASTGAGGTTDSALGGSTAATVVGSSAAGGGAPAPAMVRSRSTDSTGTGAAAGGDVVLVGSRRATSPIASSSGMGAGGGGGGGGGGRTPLGGGEAVGGMPLRRVAGSSGALPRGAADSAAGGPLPALGGAGGPLPSAASFTGSAVSLAGRPRVGR